MKKLDFFIIKSLFFIFPFAILTIITLLFYNYRVDKGDLLYLGYIPHLYKDYRKKIYELNNFPNQIYYEVLSKTKRRKFKILTIGDSFSEQENFGYKNYLAQNFSLLHIDRFISQNQIQTLCAITNGDFFDRYDIEYVVLQNIERHFCENALSTDLSKKLTLLQIDSIAKKYLQDFKGLKFELFSRNPILFPYYFTLYFLKENYISNKQVYVMESISDSLFSNNSNKLLFYYYDIESTKKNNNPENIKKLNDLLNEIAKKLEAKRIKLIVLAAPDKYDTYYEYVSLKDKLPKPLFFELLEPLNKQYKYINLKEVFSSYLDKKEKDIYFYDDTHWSPVGCQIVAEEIKKLIIEDK
ncbi:MAG: hypothetical protein N2053_03780 [Chitinispirillaceae bacterium]|nr:hypothetical protein [Chitinispirillaceae bacterium]